MRATGRVIRFTRQRDVQEFNTVGGGARQTGSPRLVLEVQVDSIDVLPESSETPVSLHTGRCDAIRVDDLEEERDAARAELRNARAQLAQAIVDRDRARRERDTAIAERRELDAARRPPAGVAVAPRRDPVRDAYERTMAVMFDEPARLSPAAIQAFESARARQIAASGAPGIVPAPRPGPVRPMSVEPRASLLGGGFAQMDAIAEAMKPKPEPKEPTRFTWLEVD